MLEKIHFTRKEAACKCGCGRDPMDYVLVEMLEDGRAHFSTRYGRVKVEISSWNRCIAHNEEMCKLYIKNYVPFSSQSQHPKAKAVDHKYFFWWNDDWVQIDSDEVYDYYDKKYPHSAGIGKYHNRTHLDSRNEKARWIG